MPNRFLTYAALIGLAAAAFGQIETDSTAVDSSLQKPFNFKTPEILFLHSLSLDSMALEASRYISVGELVDDLNGGSFFQCGSAGKPAYTSLFGSPYGKTTLLFGDLLLNHPLTDKADLNFLPTESIGRLQIVHRGGEQTFAWLPAGSALIVRPMSLADNPIRSQVGYRTGGNGYDDVDARLGAKFSERLWMDFAGTVRAYNGHRPNSLYDGHQIDARVSRRLGNNWLLQGTALLNEHSVELPLAEPIVEFANVRSPLQKERRSDYALGGRFRDRLITVFQYTILDSDLRDARRSLFNDRRDARAFFHTSEWRSRRRPLQWRAGITGRYTMLKGSRWGEHFDRRGAAYLAASYTFGRAEAGLRFAAEKAEKNEPIGLPQLHLFLWSPDSTLRAALWTGRQAEHPSLQERYAQGLFSWGNENLRPALHDQAAATVEKHFARLFLAGLMAVRQSRSPIGALYDGRHVGFANLPRARSIHFNLLGRYAFYRQMIFLKAEGYRQLTGLKPANRPDWQLQGFVQTHIIAFKGDLDLRLRLGGYLFGPRRASEPWYAEYSSVYRTLSPSIYPYFHALLHFRSADVFFAYENFIDANVEAVAGSPMPRLWLRWGFVWHFVD
ncbi:MAG: hypothetical protein ONB24_13080 [candidate division KSB1 bacterium]|nr:hypothetical protein [candidate division KSB1 bacterium]